MSADKELPNMPRSSHAFSSGSRATSSLSSSPSRSAWRPNGIVAGRTSARPPIGNRGFACADREENRAPGGRLRRGVHSADLLASNPDLLDINRSLFTGGRRAAVRPASRGERLGAATWRAFARGETRAERRDTFLGCALLEEESAGFSVDPR